VPAGFAQLIDALHRESWQILHDPPVTKSEAKVCVGTALPTKERARYVSESEIYFLMRNFALRSDVVSSQINTRCSGGLSKCGKPVFGCGKTEPSGGIV
jgi:hypothetical protein